MELEETLDTWTQVCHDFLVVKHKKSEKVVTRFIKLRYEHFLYMQSEELYC